MENSIERLKDKVKKARNQKKSRQIEKIENKRKK